MKRVIEKDRFVRKTLNKHSIEIEYYVFNQAEADKSSLVLSMGVWEPADRAFPLISRLTGRHCIVISYRGRGGSSAPTSGFDVSDHSLDLTWVLEQETVNLPVFLGFSKGVSYMLGYLSLHPGRVNGIIIIDYPAIHTKADTGYANYWSSMIYNGRKLTEFVSKSTLEGIEKESTYREFYVDFKEYHCPVCILRGMDEFSSIPSNLSDADISRYKAVLDNPEIIPFYNSGHMILDEELGKAVRHISEFLINIDSCNLLQEE